MEGSTENEDPPTSVRDQDGEEGQGQRMDQVYETRLVTHQPCCIQDTIDSNYNRIYILTYIFSANNIYYECTITRCRRTSAGLVQRKGPSGRPL